MFGFIKSLTRSAWSGLCRAARWFKNRIAAMWDAHQDALANSSSYRKQLSVLCGAVITAFAIAGPLDAVLSASVAAYIAAHVIEDDHREPWSTHSTVLPSRYDFERGW